MGCRETAIPIDCVQCRFRCEVGKRQRDLAGIERGRWILAALGDDVKCGEHQAATSFGAHQTPGPTAEALAVLHYVDSSDGVADDLVHFFQTRSWQTACARSITS